jgi:glycine cleavage system H protein
VSEIPGDLLYTEDHEYLKPTDDPTIFQVGITDYAQGELGDIVYVELPSIGSKYGKQDVFGTIEAVKAVSELFSPAAGEIADVNKRLDQEPALVNASPYDEGWMVKMRLANPKDRSGLLTADQYRAHIGQ